MTRNDDTKSCDYALDTSEEYRQKIFDFVSEYVKAENIRKCNRSIFIKASIKMLITENVFSVDEMQKQAAKDYGIIIPKRFIRECLYG